MPIDCQKLKNRFQIVTSLKRDFENILTNPEPKDVFDLKNLKEDIAGMVNRTWEGFNPLEGLIEAKKQYDSQKKILENAGILQEGYMRGPLRMPSDFPEDTFKFPTYKKIIHHLRGKEELLKEKTKWGFNKILIVPFGMEVGRLAWTLGEEMRKKMEEETLIASEVNDSKPFRLKINAESPVDLSLIDDQTTPDNLIYKESDFLKEGGDKYAVLEQGASAWRIILIQNLPQASDLGCFIGKDDYISENLRKKTIGEYLAIAGRDSISISDLQRCLENNPVFEKETPFIPEDQLMYYLTRLEEKGEIMNTGSTLNGFLSVLRGTRLRRGDWSGNKMDTLLTYFDVDKGWYTFGVVAPSTCRHAMYGLRTAVEI